MRPLGTRTDGGVLLRCRWPSSLTTLGLRMETDFVMTSDSSLGSSFYSGLLFYSVCGEVQKSQRHSQIASRRAMLEAPYPSGPEVWSGSILLVRL
ncbi:hypothetical protein RRG08_024699 [Elysia crispata]|uniref:Uncharacterized protein n=1 Tax=Elysia crispata TaxID=231223 RepID=A0AAE1CWX5_9GAST|nr:hypothetical protein RRG08_024699 [Elysia crispata]